MALICIQLRRRHARSLSPYTFQVASFIFGENVPADSSKDSEKIAMTTPVVTEMKKGQKGDKIAMTSPVTTQMSNGK